MSSTWWYYAVNNVQQGPVLEADLAANLRSGRVAMDALVWREGMAGWAPAHATDILAGRAQPVSAEPYVPALALDAESPVPGPGPGEITDADVIDAYKRAGIALGALLVSGTIAGWVGGLIGIIIGLVGIIVAHVSLPRASVIVTFFFGAVSLPVKSLLYLAIPRKVLYWDRHQTHVPTWVSVVVIGTLILMLIVYILSVIRW